jgi:hypothetical protein
MGQTFLHLGGDAVSIELVDVVDVGKAVYHPPLLQLAQGVEMKMVIALMPRLGIVAHVRSETEWAPNLDPE